MSMIICPECRSEVSNLAAACPKCGYPLAAEPDTVIITPPPAEPPPPPVVVRKVVSEEKSGFPTWALVPIALALVFVIFGFIWMMNRNETDANENVNVRVRTGTANSAAARSGEQIPTTVNPAAAAGSTVVVPPSTVNSTTTGSYPATAPPSTATNLPPAGSETVIASPALLVDKGNLMLTATVLNGRGTKQPVKAEKFYLLSKDLETILGEAGIQPTEGNYTSTLGAAIADPNRRAELQKCLAAINPYIVSRTQSNSSGNASFKDVKPDNYYLFGVTKIGNSASVWNTSVTVNPGENTIALNGSVPPTVAPDAPDLNQ